MKSIAKALAVLLKTTNPVAAGDLVVSNGITIKEITTPTPLVDWGRYILNPITNFIFKTGQALNVKCGSAKHFTLKRINMQMPIKQ